MSTPIMVPMIAPDGSIGEIPQKRVNEAVQAGGKLGVWMRSPKGEVGIIPRSNLVPALKAGGKLEKNEPTGPIGEESQVQSFDSPPVTSFKQGATAAVRGVGDVMEGIGRGAIGLAKFPYDVAKAVATKPETTGDYAAMGLGPLGLPLKRLVTDPMQATAEQSRGETGIKKTAMQFASGLPVIGPMAAGFAEQIQKPEDIGKAGGEAIAFKEFPTVVGGALGEVPAIQSYLKERNLRLGEQGIKDLSKAPAKNLQFGDDLKLSIPELQKIQREAPLEAGGNLKVRELVEKLDKRLDEKWQDDHIAVIERHPDLPVDHAAIYKAGMEKLTEGEVRADPAGAKAAQSWLNKQVNKPMNVRTADQFRHGLTLKTKAKFGQDAPILMEVQKAVAHETRQQIDASLINAGESSITKANRSWGALDNVRNTLEARMNAAERAPSRGGMALGAVTGFVGSSLKGKWLGAVLNLRELIKVAEGGPGEKLNAALDRLVKGGTPPAKPTQAAGPIAVPPQVPVPVAAPPTPPIPKPRSLAVNPPVKATPPTTPTAGGVVPVAPPVVTQTPPAAAALGNSAKITSRNFRKAAASSPVSTPELPVPQSTLRTESVVPPEPPKAAPASPVGAAPASESTLQTPKAASDYKLTGWESLTAENVKASETFYVRHIDNDAKAISFSGPMTESAAKAQTEHLNKIPNHEGAYDSAPEHVIKLFRREIKAAKPTSQGEATSIKALPEIPVKSVSPKNLKIEQEKSSKPAETVADAENVDNAHELMPLSHVRYNLNQGFLGNFTEAGNLISDGHLIINSDAILNDSLRKSLLGTEPLTGRTTLHSQALVEQEWSKRWSDAKAKTADFLGQRSLYPDASRRRGTINEVAYFAPQGENVPLLSVDASKLKVLEKMTNFDRVAVTSETEPIHLYRGDVRVGLLMPVKAAGVDVPTARYVAGGFDKIPSTPTEIPSFRQAKPSGPSTGLNRTQTEFLATKLKEVAGTLPSESLTEGTLVVVKESGKGSWEGKTVGSPSGEGQKRSIEVMPKTGKQDSPITVLMTHLLPKQVETIKVPGDGTFKIPSAEAASRLHKKITGKTLPNVPTLRSRK